MLIKWLRNNEYVLWSNWKGKKERNVKVMNVKDASW